MWFSFSIILFSREIVCRIFCDDYNIGFVFRTLKHDIQRIIIIMLCAIVKSKKKTKNKIM